MNTESQVSVLHTAYQKLTGLKLPLIAVCDARRLAWEHFIAAGHSLKELETVILWLKGEIRAERRHPGALRFSNLVEDLNRFTEELSFALAFERNTKPPPTPKAIVQQQWSKTVGESVTENTRSVGELIAQMRAAVDSK